MKQKYKKLNTLAYTLAEVIIVIGIVGVIAEFTIPALIQSFQEQVYLNQFRKIYTTLLQAYTSAAMDNGTADKWGGATDADTVTNAYNIMKPYFNLTQACPNTCARKNPLIKALSINTDEMASPISNYHFLLADGAMLKFRVEFGLRVDVDINGEKEPNKLGHDYFLLNLDQRNNAPIIKQQWGNSHIYCNKSQTAFPGWYRGGSCAYWILKHWNMDYLHRDITDEEWNN